MKKLFTITLLLLILTTLSRAQDIIDQIQAEFEQEISLNMSVWKYSPSMIPEAYQPDFNDSAWQSLMLNESVYPDSAWLRKTIVLPRQILGKALAEGGTIKLKISVDDGGICWINGANKGKFDWSGQFELTNSAKPGQTFHIAIKAINTGGPLRILNARLEWDQIQPYVDMLEDYTMSLRVGRKLLSDDTYLQVGRVKRDDGIDRSTVPRERRLKLRKQHNYVNDLKNSFGMVDWLRQFEANTGFKKMLILYGVGDHGGGPTAEMLNRIEALKRLDVYPNLEYGTATAYINWIRSHDLSFLPVWNDELYLEYHRGTYTTQSNNKKFNRQAEVQFGNAEQLAAVASLYGWHYPNKDFVDGWRGVLFNQFHDILPGSSIYPVYKDSKELYDQSLAIANHQLEVAIAYIARLINTRVKNNVRPVLIYNPLAWERTDLVELRLAVDDRKLYAVYDSKGNEIPSQIVPVDRYHNKIIFIASNIPAMGYAIYELHPTTNLAYNTALIASSTKLENEFYRLTVDSTTGWVKTIYDKRNRREILAGAGNELQLFKDTPQQWDAWNIGLGERYSSTFRGITLVESGPVRAVLRVEHDFLKPGIIKNYPTPNSYFTQDIIIYHGLNRIDFVTAVDWWEEHVMLKVAFNVTVEDTVATFEIPLGTIKRPTTNKNKWERARFEVSQQKWSDLTDRSGEYGVSLLNRAKYGGDIHGHVMRLSLLRSPKWPDPMADMGKHRIEYALYPHRKCWKYANTMHKAYEYNYPLIVKFVDSHKGKLPKTFSFISTDAANVIVHTLKKAESLKIFDNTSMRPNDAWILRLFEASGKETDAVITFPVRVKKAVLSNFLEEDGKELSVIRNQVIITLPAYRVATIKVWL